MGEKKKDRSLLADLASLAGAGVPWDEAKAKKIEVPWNENEARKVPTPWNEGKKRP